MPMTASTCVKRGAIPLAGALVISFFALGQNLFQSGYALITPAGGSTTPAVTGLLRTMNTDGVLIGETSIPAVAPIRSGLIYVDEVESRTGFVLVNPFEQTATATLILRDAAGS